MARKFSLADYVQPVNVSNLDTPAVRMIPWEDIRSNQANFYAVDDVEELAQSILLQGLLDPVVVTADPEAPGRWVLISGHRRHKAWGLLREQDGDKYAAIPAIVRHFASPEMAELALIMANSSARVLTGSELDRQAMRVQELFYALQQAGYSFPGRMRDRVAEACNVSASKLARLKVIREGLETSWQSSWEAGTLPESTAYALAQLPRDIQAKIRTANPNPSVAELHRLSAGFTAPPRKKPKAPRQTSPTPAEGAPRWQSFGQTLPREGEVVGVLDPGCAEWLDVCVYRAGRLVFLANGAASFEPKLDRYWIPLPPDVPGLGGDEDGQ